MLITQGIMNIIDMAISYRKTRDGDSCYHLFLFYVFSLKISIKGGLSVWKNKTNQMEWETYLKVV